MKKKIEMSELKSAVAEASVETKAEETVAAPIVREPKKDKFGRSQAVGKKKDAVAMSFLHKKFTYGFLSDEIDRIACFLKNQGIEKGDRVTIALPNIPSAVSSFYAVNKIGAVANMVHPLVPYELLAEYMKDTGSKLLFAFDTLLDGYFDRLIEDGFRVVVCKANDYLSAFESFFYTAFGKKRYRQIDDIRCVKFADARGTEVYHVDADESFDDVSVIMHSSGTTEKSKSAALTNKNFNTIAENTIDILPWKKKLGIGMAGLTVLPMFHAFGLGVCIHTYLSYGYDNVLIPKYSPKLIIKKLRRKNIAVIAGVPTMFAGMVAQKGFDGRHLKKLRFAFCGGDKLSAKVKTKFDYTVSKNGGECPLDEGYGLTEAAGVFSVNTRAASREGSVGKALGDAEIHVFDENGGTEVQDISQSAGTAVTLPTPEKEGFIFAAVPEEKGRESIISVGNAAFFYEYTS